MMKIHSSGALIVALMFSLEGSSALFLLSSTFFHVPTLAMDEHFLETTSLRNQT